MKQINSFLCIPFGIFFDERMFLQFLFRALFVVLRAVEVHFGAYSATSLGAYIEPNSSNILDYSPVLYDYIFWDEISDF